jgi:hypothetical protein
MFLFLSPCALRLMPRALFNRLHFFKRATIVPILCRIQCKTKKCDSELLAKYISKLKLSMLFVSSG